MVRKLAAIVDAYSTGAELAPCFSRFGYDCLHIQSSAEIPADFLPGFRPENFAVNMVAAGNDLDPMVGKLATLRPEIVLAGTETGVPLADCLADRLGLPGNDAATGMLRRDKFQMQEALRRAGLASIYQQKAATVEEAVRLSRGFARWPLVVKPLDSAGADAVTFCHDETGVREAAARILGARNRLGMPNRGVLLQECLSGQQYFVNAVSALMVCTGSRRSGRITSRPSRGRH